MQLPDHHIGANDAGIEELSSTPHDVLKLTEHPDYQAAVPTPDHFIRLLYRAGAAGTDTISPFVRGYAPESISMSCYCAGIGV